MTARWNPVRGAVAPSAGARPVSVPVVSRTKGRVLLAPAVALAAGALLLGSLAGPAFGQARATQAKPAPAGRRRPPRRPRGKGSTPSATTR